MKNEVKKSQDDSIKPNQIAKVLLYIVGLGIIMRCDMWVSVAALLLVFIYLAQRGLVQRFAMPVLQAMMGKTTLMQSRFAQSQPHAPEGHSQVRIMVDEAVDEPGWLDMGFPEPPDGFYQSSTDVWRDEPDF